MYQFDWANELLWASEETLSEGPSRLSSGDVQQTMLLHWQEHCIECAPPLCYSTCALYVARSDRKCARFVYGIYPNSRFSGLLDYGADVRFRRWGKLEAQLSAGAVSVQRHRALAKADGVLAKLVGGVARSLRRIDGQRRLNGALTLARDKALPRLARRREDYDDFVLECFAPDGEAFKLVLEQLVDDTVVFRHSFVVEPGNNYHALPASSFRLLGDRPSRILIYPENDAERRVVFTWLDFVRYQSTALSNEVAPVRRDGSGEHAAAAPAKVKCVAWDLDNTLWRGVLVEDTPVGCVVRDDAVSAIRQLDERGILQTVVSKNDHDDAWRLLVELELSEYFVYPAINWGPKSAGLRQVAEALNIGIDTFALIDDSPFERAEVSTALPMVRVYSDEAIPGLLDLPEFDVPVTEMSKRRRLSYRDQITRELAQERFGDDYLEFLRSCEMTMNIFVPTEEPAIERCLELIQRSNQLNLSGRRYTRSELTELLAVPNVLSLAIECSDRFGDYGIVGFASVDERPQTPVVRDFVLSCRVAQKRVEHALFGALARREAGRGRQLLRAELTRTPRNGPLARVFDDLPFELVSSDEAHLVLESSLDNLPVLDTLITLRSDVLGLLDLEDAHRQR